MVLATGPPPEKNSVNVGLHTDTSTETLKAWRKKVYTYQDGKH